MAPNPVPEIALRSGSGKKMPALTLGTGAYPHPTAETVIQLVLEGIKLGYRSFDCAAAYGTETFLGEGISQALSLGLLKSRDELFITTKLWSSDAHPQHVLPALKNSLQYVTLLMKFCESLLLWFDLHVLFISCAGTLSWNMLIFTLCIIL